MAFIFSKLELLKHVTTKPRIVSLTGLYRNTKGLGTMSEEEKSELFKPDRNKETVFDQIITKRIRADIIYEDDKYLAFNDINPQAPIHFLVIPKRRIPTLDEAADTDCNILGNLLLTAKKLAKKRAPHGYRVVINNGKDGCQSVYHLHVHILGGRKMHWPPG